MAPKKKPVKKRLRSLTSPVKAKAKKFPQSSIRKANKTRKRSSIELLVYKWLNDDKVVFKKEKVIGRCHVDVFLEPNIVLEINGCYFHRNVCCYPEKTKENLEIRMKDVKRYAFFRSKGFEVRTITECDIKTKPEEVKTYLRSLYPKGT